MRLLWMGDMHAEKDDLPEIGGIMAWAHDLAKANNAKIALPGDLYNDFGVARVEVVEFWADQIRDALVWEGNHDQNAEGTSSALEAHRDSCYLIRNVKPEFYETNIIVDVNGDKLGFVPFIRDNNQFITLVNNLYAAGVRLVFCHQEFQGCTYDNGYYSPHGCPLEGFPSDLKFISGHIHTAQEFGNVWYPGTCRHMTRSDIGKVKGVWLIDTAEKSRKFFPTPETISEPFRSYVITPDAPVPVIIPGERSYVDVRGPQEFIDKVMLTLPKNVKGRTFPDQVEVVSDVKESDGIPVAFYRYATRYLDAQTLSPEVRSEIIRRVQGIAPILREGVK